MDFFMDKVFPLFIVGLLLALCFVAGMVPASAVSGGASMVLFGGVLMGVICAAFVGWIGYMMLDLWGVENLTLAFLAPALLAFGVAMYPPVSVVINGGEIAEYHRAMAPVVQSYLDANFEKLDLDRTGVIVDSELDAALAGNNLTAEERRIVEYIDSQQSELGHVIGSYDTTTWIWISTGNGGGFMSPVTTTTYIYGIDKSDAQRYPAHINEKWKLW